MTDTNAAIPGGNADEPEIEDAPIADQDGDQGVDGEAGNRLIIEAMDALAEDGIPVLSTNVPLGPKQRGTGPTAITLKRDNFAAALATVRQASVASILADAPSMVAFRFDSEVIWLSAVGKKGLTVETLLTYAAKPDVWPQDVSVPIGPLLKLFPWTGSVAAVSPSRKWDSLKIKSSGPYAAAITDEAVTVIIDCPESGAAGELIIRTARGQFSLPAERCKGRRKAIPVPKHQDFPAAQVAHALRIAGKFSRRNKVYADLDVVTILGGVAAGGDPSAMTAFSSPELVNVDLSVGRRQQKPLATILRRMPRLCGMAVIGDETVFGFGVTTVRMKTISVKFRLLTPERQFAQFDRIHEFHLGETLSSLRTMDLIDPPADVGRKTSGSPLHVEVDVLDETTRARARLVALTGGGSGISVVDLKSALTGGAAEAGRYFSVPIGRLIDALSVPDAELFGKWCVDPRGRLLIELTRPDGVVRHLLGGQPAELRQSPPPRAVSETGASVTDELPPAAHNDQRAVEDTATPEGADAETAERAEHHSAIDGLRPDEQS